MNMPGMHKGFRPLSFKNSRLPAEQVVLRRRGTLGLKSWSASLLITTANLKPRKLHPFPTSPLPELVGERELGLAVAWVVPSEGSLRVAPSIGQADIIMSTSRCMPYPQPGYVPKLRVSKVLIDVRFSIPPGLCMACLLCFMKSHHFHAEAVNWCIASVTCVSYFIS